jgi:ketosteroid isomerase-like protein
LIPAQFGSLCGEQQESGPTPAEKNMGEDIHRQRVRNFLGAFYGGDIEGALACCNDDIDFVAHVPIEILPHMGRRRGKAEVAEMWRIIHAHHSSMRHELPTIVVEKDKAAVHVRLFARKKSNDRMVQIDIANFYTFRDGRISTIREFLDSFDLVQQILEHDVAADLVNHKISRDLARALTAFRGTSTGTA